MKPKNQRLFLLVVALVAVLGAVVLAMSSLRSQAAFFYAPGDVATRGLPLDRAVRIGGMVRGGSIQRHPDGVREELGETGVLRPPHEVLWQELQLSGMVDGERRLQRGTADQIVLVTSFTSLERTDN